MRYQLPINRCLDRSAPGTEFSRCRMPFPCAGATGWQIGVRHASGNRQGVELPRVRGIESDRELPDRSRRYEQISHHALPLSQPQVVHVRDQSACALVLERSKVFLPSDRGNRAISKWRCGAKWNSRTITGRSCGGDQATTYRRYRAARTVRLQPERAEPGVSQQ